MDSASSSQYLNIHPLQEARLFPNITNVRQVYDKDTRYNQQQAGRE